MKNKDFEKMSKDHFNNQAKIYDEKNTQNYSKAGKISCKRVAEYLRDIPFETLLDVGCGTGYLFERLNEIKKAKYFGLDISEEMLNVARGKNLGAEFVLGTADKLPYDDETFDIVTCNQSFHHYPYPDKAVQEVIRVLKPGGLYIISDSGIGGPLGKIIKSLIPRVTNFGDCTIQSVKDTENRMVKNSLELVHSEKMDISIYMVVGKKSKK